MREPRLLVTDLDGTLLGDPQALLRFANWYEPRRQRLRLVYASGRFFGSVVASIRQTALPCPDAIIGGVGSEIFRFPSGQRWPGWQPELQADWSAAQVDAVAAKFPLLTRQPGEFLSSCKRSFFAENWTATQLSALHIALQECGLRTELIYSSQRDLDILPAGVNKGTAARAVSEVLQLQPEEVLVAGNTGNDAALYRYGFRGVVVANADADLQEFDQGHYRARLPLADGVLEGCRYWFTQSSAAQDLNGDHGTLG